MNWMFIFLTSIILFGCNKDEMPGYTDAVIIDFDLRLCPCCGGMLVSLKSDPTDFVNAYQWYRKNEIFGVTENDIFPLKVKIIYHHLTETCVQSKGEIEITKLIKVQ